MRITRRLFSGGLMTFAVTPHAFAGLSDGRALFWSAEPAGEPPSILFGYERVAAARTADIVRDGERLADDQDRLIGAMPNVRFPKVEIPRKDTTPLVERLSKQAVERVRALLGKDEKWKPMTDTLSGIEFVALVMFEGQTPANASVGGTIAAHELSKGKPITYLLSQTDLQDMMGKPDLAALDKRIDEKTVTWLLDLHDRIGAVGQHHETLYTERRSADICKLSADMRAHGVPSFNEMGGLQADKVEATLATRAAETLKKPEDAKSFLLLPLATLCRDKGVLATLRADGVKVTPVA
ncbi:MAG TPA: hypothetical protein VGM96_18270 [Reyranella sp.]|jgi:hypothetical protein